MRLECKVLQQVVLWSCLLASPSFALDLQKALSPLNGERGRRVRTDYIILHTTEAPTKNSINSVRRYGEANYIVDPGGNIFVTVERGRIAYHAGRSMWNGQTDVDSFSIGIEVVGYHNRNITSYQYQAIRELLEYLQGKYGIPDERVLTHSMVAYGAPNRWHKKCHRGRKRCGMIFAKKDVRAKLGLDKAPAFDPDVKAGRLVNADPYLARALYGTPTEQEQALTRYSSQNANVISSQRSAWDIAGDAYNDAETVYVLPGGKNLTGNQIRDWKSLPMGTRVLVGGGAAVSKDDGIREVGVDGATAAEIAGEAYNTDSTIYFMKDGDVEFGDKITDWSLPAGTRMLVGFRHAGTVTPKRGADAICGKTWNSASTLYRKVDGTFVSGDRIARKEIATGTMVFRRI
jgi:hypothetical protein